MGSEDSIDVSDGLAVDNDFRLILDVVQAAVVKAEVLILDELTHDSEIQTLNLSPPHMEATSSIVFDGAAQARGGGTV